MMNLEISLIPFYSSGDERRFFQALHEIHAIKNVEGSGKSLQLNVNLRSLGKEALRDLIALLWRYQIALAPLARLAARQRFSWLRNNQAYWYRSMFEQDG